jgi:nicotinamide-nucleotide amidase
MTEIQPSENRKTEVSEQFLAKQLIETLTKHNATISTAESLTGGLLADAFVKVEGASSSYVGGVVMYSTELKHKLLNVDSTLLEKNGAVDPNVAIQMATNCKEIFGSTFALATTGVAGPLKQDGKPVGLVYVALASDTGVIYKELNLNGNRAEIRNNTVEKALFLLLNTINDLYYIV